MANVDKPSGFKPVGHMSGAPWNGKANVYYVGSGDSTAIYRGDMVKPAGSSDATGKYPDVAQAAATDTTLLGVAIGFGNTPQIAADVSDLSRNYRPASTAMYVLVVDDPDTIYEVQENGESDPFVAADSGLNVDIIVGSGNTTSGVSGMELDSDNYAEATATAQIRLLRAVNREDNALGAHCKWLVRINEGVHLSTTGS